MDVLVNLHILGAQKAGTTALASFLGQHPAVYLVKGKEAHVFDHPDYPIEDDGMFAQAAFQRRMQDYQQQSIVCDATPITLFNPTFIQRCRKYNPAARFIVLLREPVERAESHYHMSRSRQQESASMLKAFWSEKKRMRGLTDQQSWAFDSPYRTQSYLHRGLYTQQLSRLFAIVEPNKVLVLWQHELKQHHQQTLLRVFEFLDIHRHPIAAETVFETRQPASHWSDPLARLYARLWLRLHGQRDDQLNALLEHYQGSSKARL